MLQDDYYLNARGERIPLPSGNEALGRCHCGHPDFLHHAAAREASIGPDSGPIHVKAWWQLRLEPAIDRLQYWQKFGSRRSALPTASSFGCPSSVTPTTPSTTSARSQPKALEKPVPAIPQPNSQQSHPSATLASSTGSPSSFDPALVPATSFAKPQTQLSKFSNIPECCGASLVDDETINEQVRRARVDRWLQSSVAPQGCCDRDSQDSKGVVQQAKLKPRKSTLPSPSSTATRELRRLAKSPIHKASQRQLNVRAPTQRLGMQLRSRPHTRHVELVQCGRKLVLKMISPQRASRRSCKRPD